MMYTIKNSLNYNITNSGSTLKGEGLQYTISFNVNDNYYKIKNIPNVTTIHNLYGMIIKFVSNTDKYGYEIDARYLME